MSSNSPCRVLGDRWDGVLNDEWEIEPASLEDFDKAPEDEK